MDIGENAEYAKQILRCHKSEKLRFEFVFLFLLYERIADYFLELASSQRMNILLNLDQNRSKVSIIAKHLDATPQEVHRNFERLERNGFISKDNDGLYSVTSFGKMVLLQVPSMAFLINNQKFFKNHGFENLPVKFIHRIGSLENSKHVKGFVKVQEKWESIYKNATKYIYNILFEVSYNSDTISIILKKTRSGIKIKSVFSKSAILPQERKVIIKKYSFKKFIQDGNIQRKICKDVKVIVVLNEKEACVAFPETNGKIDVSEIFYSDEKDFHEWCLDYFNYCWENSTSFHEKKLMQ